MPSIDEIPTPALVIDLDVLESNIAAMAAWAKERGIGLRPHAKTPTSAPPWASANWQLER